MLVNSSHNRNYSIYVFISGTLGFCSPNELLPREHWINMWKVQSLPDLLPETKRKKKDCHAGNLICTTSPCILTDCACYTTWNYTPVDVPCFQRIKEWTPIVHCLECIQWTFKGFGQVHSGNCGPKLSRTILVISDPCIAFWTNATHKRKVWSNFGKKLHTVTKCYKVFIL